MIYGWRTTKTENGYKARVYSFAHGVGEKALKTATFPTRAKATGYARRWVLYLRRKRAAEAA